MKSMCQLQLYIYLLYYHQSFDVFPFPLVILVYWLEVNDKRAVMLYEVTPRKLITFRRFLFLTYYFLTFIFEV